MIELKRDVQLSYVMSNTEDYLKTQRKSLDQRLEAQELTQSEVDQIVSEKTVKTFRDKGLALFGNIGEAISTIINWNEDINNELNEAKKAYLLEQYFNKVEDQQYAILSLREMITNAQGNTLFNKIIRIIDSSPPDEELSEHLSQVLKNIIEAGEYAQLFEKHRYALAQIEKLTPQALSIINNHTRWPLINLATKTSIGPKITSDWYEEFTVSYCKKNNINDPTMLERVKHSILELQKQGLMEAFNQENGRVKCNATAIGIEIIEYLS